MKRHIGSTLALIFGILCIGAGLTQPSAISTAIAGLVIVLGSTAYKSAKMRKIGTDGLA